VRPWTAALVVLLIVSAVAVALVAWASSNSPERSSSSPTPGPTSTVEPEYDYPEVEDVGTCFDPISDRDDDAMLAMSVLDCDEPHLAEVIGTPELDGGPSARWPGQAAVDRESEDLCLTLFEDYVGISYEDSRLDGSYINPSEALWLGGDRLVICIVETSSAAPFNSSVRDLEE
jgi:hypothetical protein